MLSWCDSVYHGVMWGDPCIRHSQACPTSMYKRTFEEPPIFHPKSIGMQFFSPTRVTRHNEV